jgi:hypothetical protein
MTLNPNQLCALRLGLARRSRGWSQAEAVEQLKRHGLDWSVPVYSAAERSVSGTRTVRFDADTLVIFSLCFGYPFAWWITPPPRDAYGLLPELSPRQGRQTFSPDELTDAVTTEYGALVYALVVADGLSPAMRASLQRRLQAEPENETEE